MQLSLVLSVSALALRLPAHPQALIPRTSPAQMLARPSKSAKTKGTKDKAPSSLSDLTVYELKAVCRAKGLKVSGRKAELISRIATAPPGVSAPEGSAAATMAPPPPSPPPLSPPPPPQQQQQPPPLQEPSPDRPLPPAGLTPASPSVAARLATDVGAEVEAEVVTEDEAEAADAQKRREERRAARRGKLAQYFTEEFEGVVSSLESVAGADFAALLGRPDPRRELQQAAPSAGAAAAAASCIEAAQANGRRLAWG